MEQKSIQKRSRNLRVKKMPLGGDMYRFGLVLGAKRVPKGRHFGRRNGANIDQNTRCKFKSEKVTSWSRLGAILGRFPRRLGVKHIDFFNGF